MYHHMLLDQIQQLLLLFRILLLLRCGNWLLELVWLLLACCCCCCTAVTPGSRRHWTMNKDEQIMSGISEQQVCSYLQTEKRCAVVERQKIHRESQLSPDQCSDRSKMPDKYAITTIINEHSHDQGWKGASHDTKRCPDLQQSAPRTSDALMAESNIYWDATATNTARLQAASTCCSFVGRWGGAPLLKHLALNTASSPCMHSYLRSSAE